MPCWRETNTSTNVRPLKPGETMSRLDEQTPRFRRELGQVNSPTGSAIVNAVQEGNQYVYNWEFHRNCGYRISSLTPVECLSALDAQEAPSRLLHARHEVVPFGGRVEELRVLQHWRDDPEPRSGVLLVSAPGGAGKTRLATHFSRVSQAQGWAVAYGSLRMARRDAARALIQGPEGLLLVVDYADRWPRESLDQLITDHMNIEGEHSTRVLLISRSKGRWWEALCDDLARDGIATEALGLDAIANSDTTRSERFHDAIAAFSLALWPGKSIPDLEPPVCLPSSFDFGSALSLHLAALDAVVSQVDWDPERPPELITARAIRRELMNWYRLREMGSIQSDVADLAPVGSVACLVGPFPSVDAAAEVLASVGACSSIPDGRRISREHALAYPPRIPYGAGEPLYPDRLGEDFIALSLSCAPYELREQAGLSDTACDDLILKVFASMRKVDGSAERSRVGITRLVEVAARWPHVAESVVESLVRQQPELFVEAGGPVLERLSRMPGTTDQALESLVDTLPNISSLDLDSGAAALLETLLRRRKNSDKDTSPYGVLLARRMRWLGKPELARACIFKHQPDHDHEAESASWLQELASCESNLGRHEQARDYRQRALELYEQLAEEAQIQERWELVDRFRANAFALRLHI